MPLTTSLCEHNAVYWEGHGGYGYGYGASQITGMLILLQREEEVSEVRYISMQQLDEEMNANPEKFTEWFKIILKEYKDHL